MPASNQQSAAAASLYRPRSAKDWEEKKAEIKQLYWIEGKDLPSVIRWMRDQHGFLATTRQYKHHLQRWGLEKNIKAADKKHIVRIARRRMEEGRTTEFYVKERLVSAGRIESWMNSVALGGLLPRDVPRPPTPSYIVYQTPPNVDSSGLSSLRPHSPPPGPPISQNRDIASSALEPANLSQQHHVLALPEWVTNQQLGTEDRYLGSQRFVDNNWNLPGSRELFLDTNAAASIDDSFIENFLDLCVQGKCAVRHEGLRKVDGNPGGSYYSCPLCACTACRIRNIKCERNSDDPQAPCTACIKSHRFFYRQTLSLSWWKLTDIILFVEKQELYDVPRFPLTKWSKPLNACSKVFISTEESQPNDADHPFMLKLTPQDEGTFNRLLHVTVADHPETPSGETPEYIFEEAELISRGLKSYVDRNVAAYVASLASTLDNFIWRTYAIAVNHAAGARTTQERALIINTFRLWITAINSNRELDIIIDDRFNETLGESAVSRAAQSPGRGVVVRHDLFSQIRVVLRQKLLRPWSKAILSELETLIRSKKKEYWFTIYLVSFILLHGCAMLTESDRVLAGQVGLETEYARPETISQYHEGMRTLLAYYHTTGQTFRPFQMALDPHQQRELARVAGLTPEQTEHVRWTAKSMKQREHTNRRIQKEGAYGDPYYWISQLFNFGRI